MLGLVKVATRPGSLRASLAGLVGLLAACAGRPPPGGARRRGWWRLPDEAAPSAVSEPFEVRVLPEGWVWWLEGPGRSRDFSPEKCVCTFGIVSCLRKVKNWQGAILAPVAAQRRAEAR